jgi:hypothetical protein
MCIFNSHLRLLWVSVTAGALLASALALPAHAQAVAALNVSDINPDNSTLHDKDANGSAGGRVNGLTISVGGRTVMYAASEWGGLFESLDKGHTWQHVDSHLPSALWRVAVDPSNSDRIVTTSFYDGRQESMSGINISTDGGITWAHPASAVPPEKFCRISAFQRELTAFGVVFERKTPGNVYVGTSCGLAVSANSGQTWRFVDPTKEDPADSVWDVIVHDDGIVDVCGDDGHARSPDRGKTWAVPRQLPSGRCSLAVSPYEPNVLFAVVGKRLYESDDAGQHWGVGVPTPNYQGRVPFVATNKRSDGAFELWFGDVELYRIACRTPPAGTAATLRCPITSSSWGEAYTSEHGAHDDVGQILFDPEASANACPIAFSSDGGVYINTLNRPTDCQSPSWDQATKSPHSLWFFGMDAIANDVYFGNQDSGAFYVHLTTGTLKWANFDCCDSFSRAASSTTVVYNRCCYFDKKKLVRENQLFLADPGVLNAHQLANYPKGLIPGWQPHTVEHFEGESFVVLTTAGVFRTPNIRARIVQWDQLGGASFPADACGVTVSGVAPSSHVLFLQVGNCDGRTPSNIYRLDEKISPARWVMLKPPPQCTGFGVFATGDSGKDILAEVFAAKSSTPAIVLSRNGGQTWTPLPKLDSLLTGNGVFRYMNEKGPTDFTGFDGYSQPSALAIDPINPRLMVAAGVDAGVFISMDGGLTWVGATESSTGRVIPRVRQILFTHDKDQTDTYLGAQGAGIWRLTSVSASSKSTQVVH